LSSDAERVKLPCRAALSNARSDAIEGRNLFRIRGSNSDVGMA